jgi:hypothetical protein
MLQTLEREWWQDDIKANEFDWFSFEYLGSVEISHDNPNDDVYYIVGTQVVKGIEFEEINAFDEFNAFEIMLTNNDSDSNNRIFQFYVLHI